MKGVQVSSNEKVSSNIEATEEGSLLKILYFNARSIKMKMEELKVMIEEKKPDIIAIVESWLNEDIADSEINLKHFDMIRIDRNNESKQRGGGVLIFVNQSMKCLKIESERINNLEYAWIRIHGKGCDAVNIGVFYRPPDGDGEQVKNLIKKISKFKNSRTVLIGDFNFSDINWRNLTTGKKGKEFLKAVKNLSLNQMVKKETRGDNILDLVMVYDRNFVFKIEHFAPVGNSDHDTLGITLNTMICNQVQGLNMHNYNKANYKLLEMEVNKVDWDGEVNRLSVNDLWLLLIRILNDFKEKFVPKFQNRVKNEVPWLNATLKKIIKKRNNLYKRLSKSGQMYFKIKYKQMRNKVTKQIKILKEKYESKIIKRSKNNRKIFYSYVNSNKKGGGCRKVGPLMKINEEDGKEDLVEDDKNVAALLIDYFCTVFNKVKNEDELNMLMESRNQDDLLEIINISDEDVKIAISDFKVNKSPGIDGITSTYAIKIKDILAKPLRLLFSKSLQTNEIPEDWKKANITPIFKKGDKSLVENYRPVSLTVFFGKVLEKIIKQRIDKFLEVKGYVKNTQHGFMKGRSCLTNLLVNQHSIMKILVERGAVDIVYLDFQKAFDKVPHARLMKKIRSYR